MNSHNYNEYLASACEIAKEAGRIIMNYFSNGYEKSTKSDNSPVTEADISANNYITAALKKIAPDIPIISEEDETLEYHEYKKFFLVDPLDGTKGFVRGEPEFTVNIALIEDKHPVFGVIYCPPQDILYFGMTGKDAYKQIGLNTPRIIKTRLIPNGGLTITRSRSHPSEQTNEYLKTLDIKEIINSSSSIKLCLIAEGKADIYPRFGRTMEWDTAAGHAILQAAGGKLETTTGNPLLYNKQGFENPSFIAFGAKKLI